MKIVLVVLALVVGCKKKEATPAAVGSGSAVAAAPVEGSAAAPAPADDADCKDVDHFKLDACVAQCDAGKASGCYLAGQAWLVGDQVPDADEAKAQTYFTKACELNNAFACKWLAPMYANGLGGLTADAKKADELTAKAIGLYGPLCDKNDAQACYDLYAIAADPQQKKAAAKKACELGKPGACDAAK
jgi:hypothetical protein